MFRYLRSYEGQIKIFLFLLVAFLAVAIYVSFHLLVVSRNAIFEEVRQRIALAAEAVESDLKIRDRRLPHEDEAVLPSPFSQTQFSRIARDHGLVSLELLDPRGHVLVSSLVGRVGVGDRDLAEMGEAGRRRLLAGMTVLSSLRADGGIAYATMAGYRPLLDRAGKVTGVLRVEDQAENLASVERSLKILSAVQAGGLSALLVVIFFFARWLLAPYRRLMATADQARLGETLGGGATGEPDFLVTSFQAVLEKLRGQEQELHRLKEERGKKPGEVFLAESLANNLSSGMITFDRQGRISLVNPAALQILGRSREEVQGEECTRLFGEAGLARLVRDTLERGVPRSREMVSYRTPRGKEIHLGVGLSPLSDAGGKVERVVCLLSDLTEIRHLRDRVALKDNLAQLGELSAGIAHEFRNALATIQGYARLITRGADPEGRELAGAIAKEVEGIGKVVEAFLQFARPVTLNLTKVSLRDLLLDLAAEISPGEREGACRIAVTGEFPPLLADESLLKQAFHNLIRNAFEAMDGKGGQVRISGEREGETTVRIEVSDDGSGISPEVLPRIFTPFFTTRSRGTGLGLPLVQKTVASHDGTIEVESKIGIGTRFVIRLPLDRPSEAPRPD